jgi:uroporphyrinogen decarboxylase
MLVDDPELVAAVFSKIEEVYVAMYSGMASIEQVGVLNLSDDFGYKTQTLIGVDDLRKYVLPVHKKLAKIIHNAGKPCVLHSCGYLEEIMEDIIVDVGIDAKHSYEDLIVPVEEMKRRYGDRIAILGGFDLDRLCRSTPQQVREYTCKLVTELGADGGYALGSGNSIAAYVPVENYLAMLDEGWSLRH